MNIVIFDCIIAPRDVPNLYPRQTIDYPRQTIDRPHPHLAATHSPATPHSQHAPQLRSDRHKAF